LTTGFYRREVLLALGGFDHDAGDHLTDADLAVRLAKLELRVVLEPASRIVQVIDPLAMGGQSQFARGRVCEQLFWRSASRSGSPLALALHALAALADPAALLGRLAALVDWGAKARFERRLEVAAGRPSRVADGLKNSAARRRNPCIRKALRQAAIPHCRWPP
jgi:hypothetical protein